MDTRKLVYFLRFVLFFHIVDVRVWSCKRDDDCSQNSNSRIELCCNGDCIYWDKCAQGCKDTEDCDTKRDQVCLRHRCTEDSVTYPDGHYPQLCSSDSDCDTGGRCEDNKCTQIPTSSPRRSDRLPAWVMAVLVSGSIILAFLLGIVIYCYRRKCTSSSSQRSTRGRRSRRSQVERNLDEVATATAALRFRVNACEMSDLHHDIDSEVTGPVGPPPLYSTMPRDQTDPEPLDNFAPPSYDDAVGEETPTRPGTGS